MAYKYTSGKQMTNTSFGNSGRIAGIGIITDDYSEESGNPNYDKYESVRFPNDRINPESLNGEVIVVQKGRNKDG